MRAVDFDGLLREGLKKFFSSEALAQAIAEAGTQDPEQIHQRNVELAHAYFMGRIHEQEQTRVLLPVDRANTVYIAGPMTGLPEYNFPAFNAAAEELRATGATVYNPADHGLIDGAAWDDYLRFDIGNLVKCESIYLLPGWSNSKGARMEYKLARKLDIAVRFAPGAEQPME
ncbi:DUF4406 domain-containing protein [Xanthomonas phage RTH11]|nr:DUF4406 domain-containing protein [Xanthomonas phage RTH11]